MNKIQLLIGILALIFVACSSNNDTSEDTGIDNNKIELSFRINNFEAGTLRSTFADGSTEEQTIHNMYVFLFPTTSTQTLKSYYVPTANFTGGSWNTSNNTLLLNLTQSEAGKRDIYIVTNCISFKTKLDGVLSLADLQLILQSNNTPWNPTLNTPILMSGNKIHDFSLDYQLNNIPLQRVLAKIQLNVKLSAVHQGKPLSGENTAQYKYRFHNFDKDTYILKPTSKPNNLLSSSTWSNWNDAITSYTLDATGKATNLTLVTYLNERDNAGTAIEISLPYFDGGFLPPPEFGDETYKLQLPDKIERNRWYIYDVEI